MLTARFPKFGKYTGDCNDQREVDDISVSGDSDRDGRPVAARRYRTRHESLGSWSIADAGVGAKEMHVVYASPRGGALRQLS